MNPLSRFFHLGDLNTSGGKECLAGIVTFMTMAYIIFVNPNILSAGGVPKDAALVATCLAAGLMTLFMGLATNYPFALAPGMGIAPFLTFSIVIGLGMPWQVAMGLVLIEGLIIFILVLTNFREQVMNAIPLSLKRAIGVGIGLFIAFIGLQSAGLVVKNQATLVTFGPFTKSALISASGLLITAFLMARKVKAAIFLGIIFATVIAVVSGVVKLPSQILAVPSWTQFATFGAALDPKYLVQVFNVTLIAVTFTLLLTDFFDTLGTVVAIGGEAGFVDKDGKIPRIKSVLVVDSLAAVLGGVLGCSSVTTYVESAAGVSEGGRSGMTAVVTAGCFFLALFFWPILSIVPAAATAPALIVVGFMMMTIVREISWQDFSEAFPAFLTIIMIPLTYNIAKGIGYGFISFVVIKVFTGRYREVKPLMVLIAILFALDFYLAS
ncbi:MAG: NCS2 family permease [Syntrophales bacterium]|nr:NCS2 family permease [Syntrophales bacterium]